ncbi:FAD-binding-3 domain-containing protein [Favolaschia claudopus]|uniref:FAD-binding-3 domain-containing protein n=1 Tax=Favolaschia claudopus TaxID=2862362 RepID=A0AAW0CSE4_9AGAR
MGDSQNAGLALKFIIIGASVSGLTAAIALLKAGHSVIILEKDPQLGGVGSVPNGSGCAQLPPNACKILLDWGLEAEIQATCAPVSGFSVYKYGAGDLSDPDYLGINLWDPEMLIEARGGYMQLSHRALIRILHDLALKSSTASSSINENETRLSVVSGAEVVSVDCDACSVTTRLGDIYKGDVIIGADGAGGIVRRILMDEEDLSPEDDILTGIAAYSAIVPNKSVVENAALKPLFDAQPGCTLWLGSNRGVRTFPVGQEHDVSMLIYTTDSSQDGTWIQEAEKKLPDILGPCNEYLRNMAQSTGIATCVQIKEHCKLDSWVTESGKVVALGEAAHPLPPGSVHAYSIGMEDGVFLGKLFSHITDHDQITEFLHAFQEHREPRCASIYQMEKDYIYQITLPDGEVQVQRDIAMRARGERGENVLGGDLQEMMEDFRMVFGYDAMDDADEWWMTWGRYRDSSARLSQSEGNIFNMLFASMSSNTCEDVGQEEGEEKHYVHEFDTHDHDI